MRDPVSVTDCKHPRYTHCVRFPGRMDRGWTLTNPVPVAKRAKNKTAKLATWLRPHAATAGPIAPGDMSRRYDYKKVLASLATKDAKGNVTKAFIFPSNAARHSFVTFHLFHLRNAGETALQLGHKSNPTMLHEHSKNPTAEKHAAAFWKIYPTEAKTVISIEQSTVEENKPATPKRKAAR